MSTKSKIPAVVRAYLRRAPKIKGYRVLSPTVKAKPGDCFVYLHGYAYYYEEPVLLSTCGFLRIGRTLLEGRRAALSCRSYLAKDFDGILYRPIR